MLENGLFAVCSRGMKQSNWTDFLFGGQLYEEILVAFTRKN